MTAETIMVGRTFVEQFKGRDLNSLCDFVDAGRAWLDRFLKADSELMHHGVEGQEWGVRNGPPYPLSRKQKSSKETSDVKKGVAKNSESCRILNEEAKREKVKISINREKQLRHTQSGHIPGRSYLNGELDFAEELLKTYSGTGKLLYINGKWNHRERVKAPSKIGTYVDVNGNTEDTNTMIIVYSKTGSHIIPARNGG